MRTNSKGEEVSYDPPHYEYSYDFYGEIHINHPYFDEITFQINSDAVNLEMVERNSGFGGMRNGFDPMMHREYRQYRSMCDELEELFRFVLQRRRR